NDLVLQCDETLVARRVAGRVVSMTGAPIAGLTVCGALLVTDDGIPKVNARWARGNSAVTDEDGAFELPEDASRPLRLIVVGGGVVLHDFTFETMATSEAWE